MAETRACILSGASGGLGREIATQILEDAVFDAYVFLFRAIEKSSFLEEYRGEKYCIPFSLEEGKPDLTEVRLERFQEIILVLTAFSIEPIQSLKLISKEVVENYFKTNVLGQIDLVQEVLHLVSSDCKIRIVSLASGAVNQVFEGWGLYSCGKSFFNRYLEQLSIEENIPTVLYSPGVMDTGMQTCIREKTDKNSSVAAFFTEKYKKGDLRNPKYVAKDIVERYLKEWTAKELREKVSSTEMRDIYLSQIQYKA